MPHHNVSVYGGKYEFKTLEDDWRIHVLRYGKPWLIVEAGHNAILALMLELEEAREKLDRFDAEAFHRDHT